MNTEFITQHKSLMLLFMGVCIFLAVPFFSVTYIPSTDLPQHLAQMRLLEELVQGGAHGEFALSTYGANCLVYLLLGLNWLVFSPILAGKLTILEIGLLWTFATFVLAQREKRSPASAILASLMFFNAALYWGLLNFLIGWPAFVAWYIFVVAPEEKQANTGKTLVIVASLSLLLFFAHTLWLAAGVALLFVFSLLYRFPWKRIGTNALGLVPVVILSMMWYPGMVAVRTQLRFNMHPHWLTSPIGRMNPSWLIEQGFCGIRGFMGYLFFACFLLWILLSIATQHRTFWSLVHRPFFTVALLVFVFVLLAPDQYVNTILFASRWLPIGMIFLLISLPAPRLPDFFSEALAFLLAVIITISTAFHWSLYERLENEGLKESLSKIPENSKVLGLDFTKESEVLYGMPFMQTFAYSQVLHRGRLSFSFAEHHSGIVSFAQIDTSRQWTQGLEWLADRVQYKDFFHFDYVLMRGSEAIHREIGSLPVLKRITTGGVWRLYRCLKDSASIPSMKPLISQKE